MHVIKIFLSLSRPLLNLITLSSVVVPIGCIVMLAFPGEFALFGSSTPTSTVGSLIPLDLVA